MSCDCWRSLSLPHGAVVVPKFVIVVVLDHTHFSPKKEMTVALELCTLKVYSRLKCTHFVCGSTIAIHFYC